MKASFNCRVHPLFRDQSNSLSYQAFSHSVVLRIIEESRVSTVPSQFRLKDRSYGASAKFVTSTILAFSTNFVFGPKANSLRIVAGINCS